MLSNLVDENNSSLERKIIILYCILPWPMFCVYGANTANILEIEMNEMAIQRIFSKLKWMKWNEMNEMEKICPQRTDK